MWNQVWTNNNSSDVMYDPRQCERADNNNSNFGSTLSSMESFNEAKLSARRLAEWKIASDLMTANAAGHFPDASFGHFQVASLPQERDHRNEEGKTRGDFGNKLVRSESVLTSCSSSSSSTTSSGQGGTGTTSKGERYKTELCRPFEDSGSCKYGNKCQFAHGAHDLRGMARHPKYKTDKCRTFYTTGLCPYGQRCHFIHTTAPDSTGMNNDIETLSGFGDFRDASADLNLSPSSEYQSWFDNQLLFQLQQQQQSQLRQQQLQQQHQPISGPSMMNNNSQLYYNNNTQQQHNNNNSACQNRNFVNPAPRATYDISVQEGDAFRNAAPPSRGHSNDTQISEMLSSEPTNQIQINQLVAALTNILKLNPVDEKKPTPLTPTFLQNKMSFGSSTPPPHIFGSPLSEDSLYSSAVCSPSKSYGSSSSGVSLNPSPTTELYDVFGAFDSKIRRSVEADWSTRAPTGNVWSHCPTVSNIFS